MGILRIGKGILLSVKLSTKILLRVSGAENEESEEGGGWSSYVYRWTSFTWPSPLPPPPKKKAKEKKTWLLDSRHGQKQTEVGAKNSRSGTILRYPAVVMKVYVWKRVAEFIFYNDVKLFILYHEANQKAGKPSGIGRCPSGPCNGNWCSYVLFG